MEIFGNPDERVFQNVKIFLYFKGPNSNGLIKKKLTYVLQVFIDFFVLILNYGCFFVFLTAVFISSTITDRKRTRRLPCLLSSYLDLIS